MTEEEATSRHIQNTTCYLLCEVNTTAKTSKIGHVCKAKDCHIYFAMVCFAVMTCKLVVLVHFTLVWGGGGSLACLTHLGNNKSVLEDLFSFFFSLDARNAQSVVHRWSKTCPVVGLGMF